MSDCHCPAPQDFRARLNASTTAADAGRAFFTVAAATRLARVTQGKCLFTLREKCLRPKHHVGMTVKSPAIPEFNPGYEAFKSDKSFSSYQVSHMYHRRISRESHFVI
jgi:hypothetical protein